MLRPLLAVALGALALAAPTAAGTVVAAGERDAGRTIRLTRGDILAVSLPANATTGYAWHVAAVNRRVLQPDATGYVASKHKPGIVGTGGIAVLTFRAEARGRTTLRLTYVGPGRNPPVARRFVLVVAVG